MYAKRKSTWHVLHLILTIVFLPWAIIWIICTMSNNAYNRNLQHYEMLDAMGRINTASNKPNREE